MSSSDNAGEEDVEEEDGEISTDLKSKTLVFWTIASVNYQRNYRDALAKPKPLLSTPVKPASATIYSDETQSKTHPITRFSPVDEVQSGRQASIVISGGYKDNEDGGVKVGKTRMQCNVVIRNWRGETLHWSGACIEFKSDPWAKISGEPQR